MSELELVRLSNLTGPGWTVKPTWETMRSWGGIPAELHSDDGDSRVIRITAILERTAVYEPLTARDNSERQLASLDRFWIKPTAVEVSRSTGKLADMFQSGNRGRAASAAARKYQELAD